MFLFNILILILSAIFIYFGVSLLVTNARKFALKMKISPFIVGAILVGWGTSFPEFITGISSSIRGVPEISLGNVIGANLIDLLLIMGVITVLFQLKAEMRNVKREVIWTIISTIALLLLISDLNLSRLESVVLLLMMVIYLSLVYREIISVRKITHNPSYIAHGKPFFYLLNSISGLIVVTIGTNLMLTSATFFVDRYNLSKAFIGLTIVSCVTTLPEFLASYIAAMRKNYDISISNILGTVIFNTLVVAGVVGTILPFDVTKSTICYVIAVMAAIFFFWFCLRSGAMISRREGVAMILLYVIVISLIVRFLKS